MGFGTASRPCGRRVLHARVPTVFSRESRRARTIREITRTSPVTTTYRSVIREGRYRRRPEEKARTNMLRYYNNVRKQYARGPQPLRIRVRYAVHGCNAGTLYYKILVPGKRTETARGETVTERGRKKKKWTNKKGPSVRCGQAPVQDTVVRITPPRRWKLKSLRNASKSRTIIGGSY